MAKKSKKQQAGGTPATVALTAAGVEYTVHAYEHDPAHPSYGEEAAEAMGVSPERVFKTLVADVDGALVVAVVPVAGSLDLKSLATAVGGKRAAMADPTLAERTPMRHRCRVCIWARRRTQRSPASAFPPPKSPPCRAFTSRIPTKQRSRASIRCRPRNRPRPERTPRFRTNRPLRALTPRFRSSRRTPGALRPRRSNPRIPDPTPRFPSATAREAR